jgi:hypothetical protein
MVKKSARKNTKKEGIRLCQLDQLLVAQPVFGPGNVDIGLSQIG